MTEVWGLLGDIEFTVDVQPSSFVHDRTVSLAEQARILDVPCQQYTGRQPETLKLGVKLSRSWCNPDDQMREFWKAQDLHKPMRLVLGQGLYKKSFLISKISTRLTRTMPDGTTECIEADLSLIEVPAALPPREPGLAVRRGGYLLMRT